MFPENILLRFIGLFGIVAIALIIFALIIWRGSVLLGISLQTKTIILLSLGILLLMITSMALSSIPGTVAETIGSLILWCIYTLWILAPLLIVVDILHIWYKLPIWIFMSLATIWIGIGIYLGNVSKTTLLVIENTGLSKSQKIIFISDLHVEAIHGKRYVQKIVDQIKEKKPDLVLLGGDLMNRAKSDYVSAFEAFNELNIPIYATFGNHDHMGDKEAIKNIFTTTKIIPLRNQSIHLNEVQVVGIDDKSYRSGKTLNDVLKESDIQTNARYTILVSHQPQLLGKLAEYPINLELAGHTHRGQFIPLSWIIGLFNDYAYGRYDDYSLGKTAFVSQGIGTWGAPIRMGTQSEIVEIILKP